MLKVLTVGDGDLTLSLALARAYGHHIHLTATVLDSHTDLVEAFPEVTSHIQELLERKVEIVYQVDATQLHQRYPSKYYDMVLFHHPHLGLSSLGIDEAQHAQFHHVLLCHYLYSANQISHRVHLCLCGTQPETWGMTKAAERNHLVQSHKFPTAAPFSKLWAVAPQESIPDAQPAQPDFAAPRKYRNGKLGSKHFLGKYGYCHRRTAGEKYNGASTDMNVSGSFHFVFESKGGSTIEDNRPIKESTTTESSGFPCSICGVNFDSQKSLEDHLASPAKPTSSEESNRNAILQTDAKILPAAKRKTTNEDVTPSTKRRQRDSTTVQGEPSGHGTGEKLEIVVTAEHDGKRLRWFLQHQLKKSKREAKETIQRGCVCIDGSSVNDSSRILKEGMKLELSTLLPEISSEAATQPIKVLQRSYPFLVVEKPCGLRTKGFFPGTLESTLARQEGSRYESLSKLDTSCAGVCLMVSYRRIYECPVVKPSVKHRMVALVHGTVPDAWSPTHTLHVPIKEKWRKKKQSSNGADGNTRPKTEMVWVNPLERTGASPSTVDPIALSTILIETNNPSSASVCQWLRNEGYPVVGDMNCRQEYLQLKRSIRNRIKDKLCIQCGQVEWGSPERVTSVPIGAPIVPDKLSASYWESFTHTHD